ncbi:S41 family peptidase [Cysteiniphilum sp. JM-1]|uniref:S41 family peptidase n=1 Tax=Cysteiniphilum sp. JM-1 TaxID=2610891 RepID=UPI0012457FD9|nr:S41 family peptidase [Cysteiniphilum sp. JM-1]
MKKINFTLCISLFGLLCMPVFSQSDQVNQVNQVGQSLETQKQIDKLSRSIGLVKQAYVDELTDEEILEGAIDGMLHSLDPHSRFLDDDDFEDLQMSVHGEFAGLGMHVSAENERIKVISPIDDTPAQRAGVKAGDYIIKINDISVAGLTLDEAVKKMRGQPGTEVSITLLRPKAPKPIKLSLIRENIKLDSVKSEIVAEDYGYLRISQFQGNTAEELKQNIDKLVKENTHLKGYVLDLRNNPGGLLDAAVAVSDTFLQVTPANPKKIVFTKSRNPLESITSYAVSDDYTHGLPMVVLVNMGSASASEIVAGALQDHQRAVIVGVKTFGKGSVQTVIPISETNAVKLTTARYYTPNGVAIQSRGVIPDVIIDEEEIDLLADKTKGDKNDSDNLDFVFDESSFEHAIVSNNDVQKDKATKEALANYKKDYKNAQSLLHKDKQLAQAISILKVLNAMNKMPSNNALANA